MNSPPIDNHSEQSLRRIPVIKEAGFSVSSMFVPIQFAILFAVLVVGFLLSLVSYSSFNLTLNDGWQVLLNFDTNNINHQIISTLRLPRALVAMMAGMGMALAGLLMQGITRNPLASPSLFGIGYGAGLAFTLSSLGLLPFVTELPIVLVCFIGALITGVLVFFMGGLHLSRINPIRVVLAGVALNFMLVSLVRALVIFADNGAFSIFYWLVGNVSNAQYTDVDLAFPWLILGFSLALFISHKLNLLALGEDMMQSLGAGLTHIRLIGGFSIILLIATSVSIAGPISFVGLIVPHICRFLIGRDHRLLVPFVTLAGGSLMLFADVLSRAIDFPNDNPIGIVTALIGAPFFLYLATRTRND